MLGKKEGREITLKFLFCQEFNEVETPITARVNQFRSSFKASEAAWLTATAIIDCIHEKKEVIDEAFKKHLQNWSMERVSLTDKNILRMATAEILFLETPPKVAIDEALELSKRFSTLESAAFINGILDAVLKESGKSV